MRVNLLLIATVFTATILAAPAGGQMVKNGGAKGWAAFGTADVAASSSATVYTVPAELQFILTTFCNENASMDLSGSTLEKIIDSGHLGNQQRCLNFASGIPIPAGEVLSCDNGDSVEVNCLVEGVLTKK